MGVGERAGRAVRAWVLVAALAAGVAGCGSTAPQPYDVVYAYLGQIAEGNYASACNQLDPHTREALLTALGGRIGCPQVFRRCLPSYALNLSRDQTQLFYATILVTVHHRRADVIVRGTAVSRALKRVTLRDERGTWRLTSWGAALDRCPRHPPRRTSRPAKRRPLRHRHGHPS